MTQQARPIQTTGPAAAAPPGGSLTEAADTSFVGHAVVVAFTTMLSRVAGLVRDLVLGRIFGDTALGSSFAAAFAIPNLFRRLFGEGALAASFVPEYAQLVKHDPSLAHRFASLTAALLIVATGLLTLAGEAVLTVVLAVSAHDPDRAVFLRLTMIMLPYMPLVCLAAVLGGILQTHRQFWQTAAAPLVLNACIIGAALTSYLLIPPLHAALSTAHAVAWSVIGAGVIQAAWSYAALRPHVEWSHGFAGTRHAARRMARRFVPAVIGMGTLQINAFLDTLIAMWPIWVGPAIFGLSYPLDEASNSVLFYSQRLYQFPLGVFGIAVATAVFPALARTSDEPGPFIDTLRRGLRLSLFIGLPASIGLMMIRRPLVMTLYTGGGSAFSEQGAVRAAAVLLGYAPAVWAYSLNHVLTRAFYARGDTRTPMRVAMVVVALNLTLNLTLIWPLAEAGLAWATSATAVIQCAVLSILLTRRLGTSLIDRETRAAMASTIALAAAMGVAVAIALAVVPARPTAPWPMHLARLLAATLTGAVVFGVLARLTRRAELDWLLRR